MTDPVERHIAAYLVWASDGDQDTAKTAAITGISRRTIQFWQKRDDWRGQWVATTAPEAERAALQGKAMLRYAVPVMAKRLIHIIGATVPMRHPFSGEIVTDDAGQPIMQYASADKDAVNAAKLLALYSLGHPLSSTDVLGESILTASYSMPADEPNGHEPGSETVAELRARASAMLEATVASVNTRTDSKGRHRV